MPRFRPLPLKDVCFYCGSLTEAADATLITKTDDSRTIRTPYHRACLKPIRRWAKRQPRPVSTLVFSREALLRITPEEVTSTQNVDVMEFTSSPADDVTVRWHKENTT